MARGTGSTAARANAWPICVAPTGWRQGHFSSAEAPRGWHEKRPERFLADLYNLPSLDSYLKDRDIDLLESQNGDDALRIATDGRPDLILQDVLTPGPTVSPCGLTSRPTRARRRFS